LITCIKKIEREPGSAKAVEDAPLDYKNNIGLMKEINLLFTKGMMDGGRSTALA